MGRHKNNAGAPAPEETPEEVTPPADAPVADPAEEPETAPQAPEVEPTAPEETPETETVFMPEKREFKSIESEEDAVEFVRQSFKVPADIKTVFVSQDMNVFYRANTATLHAKQNNLKLFAIKWD